MPNEPLHKPFFFQVLDVRVIAQSFATNKELTKLLNNSDLAF